MNISNTDKIQLIAIIHVKIKLTNQQESSYHHFHSL